MAAKRKLDELSDGELADRWGAMKDREDDAGETIKALKEEFERRGLQLALGAKFRVIKDVTSQTRFDVALARAGLGAEAKKYEKTASRTQYLVRPVGGAA